MASSSNAVPVGPVDWEKLHQQPFLYEDGCWTTCGGGFCCSNDHPDFSFNFIPMQGTTIIYMEDEYRYLKSIGKVPELRVAGEAPMEFVVSLGDGKELKLLHTTCRLLGRCDGVFQKPLLCRLYPVLPVFDVAGTLEEVIPGSIFDLTFDLIASPTPCTVHGRSGEYLRQWTAKPELIDSLRHPYIMLYLRVAKIFSEAYRAGLSGNQRLTKLKGKSFWSRWELSYLTGKLADSQRITSEAATAYRELRTHYGEFL